jgi:hypothetical protein
MARAICDHQRACRVGSPPGRLSIFEEKLPAREAAFILPSSPKVGPARNLAGDGIQPEEVYR